MPILVRTDTELEAQLPALAAATEVTVDTEFHPERAYFPKLMLLQLRPDEGETMLIDPLGGVSLAALAPALSGKSLLLHGGEFDLGILSRHAGVRPGAIFDTQVAAGFVGLGYPKSLRELVQRTLGRSIDKGETLSDWSRRPLSEQQIRYAADDVRILAELANALRRRLRDAGHEALSAECHAERLAAALAPPDPDGAWRKVQSGWLDDRERAALQALAAWRERLGMRQDVPPRSIVHDGALLDLARRRPQSVEQMRENRRLPSQLWKQHASDVLAALAAARDLPAPPASRRGLAVDLARLAAKVAEGCSGIAADLVLADCDLDYIMEEKAAASWRAAALGTEWRDFVDGRRSIAMPGVWSQT